MDRLARRGRRRPGPGPGRGSCCRKLLERARELAARHAAAGQHAVHQHHPAASSEPWFPGDEAARARASAAASGGTPRSMVISANKNADGIGGHLSTFASLGRRSTTSASTTSSAARTTARPATTSTSRATPRPASTPGPSSRAASTSRSSISFRMEIGGGGLSSYPHPRLMPDFWEYPTVSMGLGPINSIYHARVQPLPPQPPHRRHVGIAGVVLRRRRRDATSPRRSARSRSPAARELDNLIWVVNCNLQRLDGPVRGNGKIIQELEAIFRGAGWNVIKVIWGTQVGRAAGATTSTACCSTR